MRGIIQVLKSEIRHIEANKKALRSFGIVVGGVVALLDVYFYWKNAFVLTNLIQVLGISAFALMILGAFLPLLLRPIYKVWMSIAVVMGFVMTNVILCVFFLTLITPIGLFRRMLGKDDMKRKWNDEINSYWQPKTYHDESPKRFERYF